LYVEQGKVNAQPPKSDLEKTIYIIDNYQGLTPARIEEKEEIEYTQEFSSLLMPLFNDKSFIDRLIVAIRRYYGIDGIKTFIFDWSKIKPELEKLQGQKIDKKRLEDLLLDNLAELMTKKGKVQPRIMPEHPEGFSPQSKKQPAKPFVPKSKIPIRLKPEPTGHEELDRLRKQNYEEYEKEWSVPELEELSHEQMKKYRFEQKIDEAHRQLEVDKIMLNLFNLANDGYIVSFKNIENVKLLQKQLQKILVHMPTYKALEAGCTLEYAKQIFYPDNKNFTDIIIYALRHFINAQHAIERDKLINFLYDGFKLTDKRGETWNFLFKDVTRDILDDFYKLDYDITIFGNHITLRKIKDIEEYYPDNMDLRISVFTKKI